MNHSHQRLLDWKPKNKSKTEPKTKQKAKSGEKKKVAEKKVVAGKKKVGVKRSEEEKSSKKKTEKLPTSPANTSFVLSPAQEVKEPKHTLSNYKCSKETTNEFEKMCEEYQDIFSTCQTDIGHTKLITMDIDTGDSPPIAQKPYTVALKHAEWLQTELDQLEKAGIIQKCLSPWASPIVIVPKKSIPGAPPQRRMCVDYRALNSLLPPVTKANSKAKGVISFVPLPKIEELFGRLQGTKIYTSLDCTSGYHHIGLSEEAQLKSAFVTPFGKYKFTKVPFGLAQAPAYFQQLVYYILSGFTFAFAYLDDILIFSKDEKEHLKHLRKVFERLREADLKLKKIKCDFFKKELSYLGHILTPDGISPQPDKLKAIKEMPQPKNPKEIRQVLGLTGYYRKFIPCYSDLTKPLTKLTRKEVEFTWDDTCEKAYDILKQALQTAPILVYPDPNKPYVLFTDASKHAWAGVLTQAQDGIQHPVTYVSGLFRGSQLNWAALTKEAFAIYKSIKKLTYYICDAPLTLRSDHLPLKKFLRQNTANNVVNNWAVEIESKQVTFEFLAGKKNTLADTLSRLVNMNITEKQEDEPYGYEYGKYIFDEYTAEESILQIQIMELEADKKLFAIQLTPDEMKEEQTKDKYCTQVEKQLEKGPTKRFYKDPEGLLMCKMKSDGQKYEVTLLPAHLARVALDIAHDQLGHNGSHRTYEFLKRLFYWNNMARDIDLYCKKCLACRRINSRPFRYPSLHLQIPTVPMQFISMDLIGPLQGSSDNTYALTAIDMLTNYLWCIPIPCKSATAVITAYQQKIFAEFGGSIKILTDNGSEFKNAVFKAVTSSLGIRHVTSSPYHPQGNGRIENAHNFLKNFIRKHQDVKKFPWDHLTCMASAAFNMFPSQHSRESAFFLMFGRDPITPLNYILGPKLRYVGDEFGFLQLDVLRQCYATAAFNLKKARDRNPEELKKPPDRPLKVGDPVIVRNHVREMWDPKYLVDYRVVAFPSERQVEIAAPDGKTRKVNIQDVHFQYPANQVIRHLPDAACFGRAAKYVYHPDNIPDLEWKIQKDLGPEGTPKAAEDKAEGAPAPTEKTPTQTPAEKATDQAPAEETPEKTPEQTPTEKVPEKAPTDTKAPAEKTADR